MASASTPWKNGISSGISDVAITSVYFEKTRLKKLIMMLINKQETMVFGGKGFSKIVRKLVTEKLFTSK